MARKVTSVIDAVHPVRQLPPAEGVRYRDIDDESFLVEIEALFREQYSDAYIEAEDDALTRLGLLDPEDDLEELILALYAGEVLAYYDPATTTFSLIACSRPQAL